MTFKLRCTDVSAAKTDRQIFDQFETIGMLVVICILFVSWCRSYYLGQLNVKWIQSMISKNDLMMQ